MAMDSGWDGACLKGYREAARATQRDLAEAVGVPLGCVKSMEAGRTPVTEEAADACWDLFLDELEGLVSEARAVKAAGGVATVGIWRAGQNFRPGDSGHTDALSANGHALALATLLALDGREFVFEYLD